jgi:capsular polysaccharide biosynthesis protein
MLNTAIAMVLGMFVGVGAAFVAEFSDPSFKTAEEIERSLGLPILGAVPAHAGMPGANPGRRKRKA